MPANNNYATEFQEKKTLKVAIIGQSLFAAEVYKLIKNNGHDIVGVFTIPDQGSKEDPLGNEKHFSKNKIIPNNIFLK